MPLLDIIYVNFNSTDCLIESIEMLFKHNQSKHDLHIVVVDNSSKDNPHRLTERFPEIQLIQNRDNIGFGAAINLALPFCQSKYVLLLNPDSFVTDGCVENSIFFMDQNDHIGIMGPMVLETNGGVQGSARAFPTPLTSLFGRNSPLTKMFPNNSITRSNILTWGKDNTTPMEVDWVSGACMVVRKEVMEAVGGFDERFFLYWEDTDLCRRIRDAGWKVVYYPGASVIHSVGKSSSTRPVFANYQFHKSCYLLYKKYAKWPLSLFTPAAGIALMLRFLTAVLFNHFNNTLNIIRTRKHHRKKEAMRNDRIRILRVISRLNIGGPSIHVRNLTEGLDKNQFEMKLISGSISPNEGDMSYITDFSKDVRIVVPELQREINLFKDIVALFKTIKACNKFKPDIVHSHTSKAGTISRISAICCNLFRSRKIKIVHTFHGNVLESYFGSHKTFIIKTIEKTLAKFTDRIIAISSTQKWHLSKKFKIAPSSKISTIKLGFNLMPFLHAYKFKGTLRKTIAVSDDILLIGIVGRLVPIKNHKMFLDAVGLFLQKCDGVKVKFILVGDGELKQSLENYCFEIGLKDHVVFYGWEKNIPMIYADLDILALTSLNEGTPVSIIEAMAASVPVITTGVGGVKDLLGRIESEQPPGNGFKICERGILSPKDDPITFSNALKYMIESGYLLDNGRFAKARNSVAKNYSVERLIRDVETLYKRLVN